MSRRSELLECELTSTVDYPNVRREEIGLWPKPGTPFNGLIPDIWWHGSDWFNQLTNINKEIEAVKKLDLIVCQDSTITPSGLWADILLPAATHFERHDVALPWYKGHYYSRRSDCRKASICGCHGHAALAILVVIRSQNTQGVLSPTWVLDLRA